MTSNFSRVAISRYLFLAGCTVAVLPAQTMRFSDSSKPEITYAYVLRSTVNTISGSWSGSAPLLRYAQSHTGTYVVFSEGGVLRRLDTPARMLELERAQAPMRELEAKQKALGAEQTPLEEQQRRLEAQQQAAQDPQEHSRVGIVQGAIGREQGTIGRVQGEIGRQQGEVGRAFNGKVQSMIEDCFRDKSCPLVATETARR